MHQFARLHVHFIILLSCFHGIAQENPLKFSTYIDTYYAYDFSHPLDNQRYFVTQYDRHNEFNINHAWIKASYNKDKIRTELALQLGTYPINNYSAEPDQFYRMIHSAKVGYQISQKSWLDFGVMGGHFGYESVLAIDRELLSPALATEYTPYYQTGIQYTLTVSESTEIRAVVLNGWQNMAETNNHKSIGMAIDQKLGENMLLSYGNYYGNERTEGAEDLLRFHNNLVMSYTPGDKFTLTGIVDYTRQDSLNQLKEAFFLTAIASNQLMDQFRIAGRYEYVRDGDRLLINAITTPFDIHIVSMVLEFTPQSNVSIKFESKFYSGKNRNFAGSDGSGPSTLVFNAGFAVRLE
ncbi:MAG: hypothetical protein ACJA08_000965 [Cyclobacteriaceae bacterium]|jgi:hypothetical protein